MSLLCCLVISLNLFTLLKQAGSSSPREVIDLEPPIRISDEAVAMGFQTVKSMAYQSYLLEYPKTDNAGFGYCVSKLFSWLSVVRGFTFSGHKLGCNEPIMNVSRGKNLNWMLEHWRGATEGKGLGNLQDRSTIEYRKLYSLKSARILATIGTEEKRWHSSTEFLDEERHESIYCTVAKILRGCSAITTSVQKAEIITSFSLFPVPQHSSYLASSGKRHEKFIKWHGTGRL